MKKLINGTDTVLEESLDGLAAAHADILVLGAERKFVRRRTLKPGKVALISGGGSAMFDLPLDSTITLEDTAKFHEVLLGAGAPINEINTLRKHFSAVKGGRLAMAAPEATKVSVLLPDVPLRTLDALSSGPTSPDHSTLAEVRAILDKYEIAPKLPASVREFFEQEIKSGKEPRTTAAGDYPMRKGDWKKPVKGQPQLSKLD